MKDQIKALTEAIREHDHAYYVMNDPVISDQQYDALFSKLICLEAEYPEFADTNSPTTRVGSDITNSFRKYQHPEPMLSVKSVYSINEFKKTIVNAKSYTIEQKLDGVGIELEYRNGSLHRALTRGNGIEGEDVTDNIRTIKSIPLNVASANTIYVRGEIVITTKGLKEVNHIRKQNNLAPYPNQRNAAASLVMSKTSADCAEFACQNLKAVFYDVIGVRSDQFEKLIYLNLLDFNVPQYATARTLAEAMAEVQWMIDNESKNDYPTDGVIVKIDKHELQKQLGQTGRHVNWAWALKEKSDEVITRFHYIDYSISQNGTITPVVHFRPVNHNGINYTSAKIDWNTLDALKLTLLCNIHIKIKGSVSAEIIRSSGNTEISLAVEPLLWCPCCKKPLAISNNTRRCFNPDCPEKTGSYSHLISDHKILTTTHNYGSLSLLRFAASETPAIVARNRKGSSTPVILYQSINHVSHTMQTLGFIGKHA